MGGLNPPSSLLDHILYDGIHQSFRHSGVVNVKMMFH
jgi:hypothetical protein